MPLLNLKSDLSNYKGNLNVNKSTEQITMGNAKLVTPNKDFSGFDMTKIQSTLSRDHKPLSPQTKQINQPSLAVNAEWLKQKEIFKYNSLFNVGINNTKEFKTTRLQSVFLNPLKQDKSLLILNSKLTPSIIQQFNYVKEKLSNIDIKKIEYDINDYKSDIKLEDIRKTTVINNTVLNRNYEYNLNEINYESQSKLKKVNRFNNSNSNLNSNFEINKEYVKTNTDILSDKFKSVNIKTNDFGVIDLSNTKLYNSKYNIEVKKETILISNKSNQTPNLNLQFQDNTLEYKLPELSSNISRLVGVADMNSVFNDIIKIGLSDITNKKIYNSSYDIDKLKGVNHFDDTFSTNFIIKTQTESNYSLKNHSQFTFKDVQSVNDFVVNVQHNYSFYNPTDSRFSYKNNLVNMISDYNAIGFTYKEKDTLYKINSTNLRWKNDKIQSINFIDVTNEFANQFELRQLNSNYKTNSTSLRWKGNKIPNVNFIDIKNINQEGFNLNINHFETKYRTNSSRFVWSDKIPNVNYLDQTNINQQGFNLNTELLRTYYNKDTTSLRWKGNKIPNVNYLDIKNINQDGFNLNTELLKTYYNKDTTSLRWKGNKIPNVNFIDKENIYQQGFNLNTELLKTYYNKDISNFDFNGTKFNAPETNYFDIGRVNSGLGFKKLIRHHESDYIKDSSLLDFNGNDAPTVNYFDRIKRNTKIGFLKNVRLNDSDYIKDSSLLDWDGSSKTGPSVNYLDMKNTFHRGFNKFPISKVTNYNNDTSEYVWKGDNILNINHLDVGKKNTKQGFIIRTLRLSDYKFDTTDLRWKGSNVLAMDFFNNTNSKNFQLRQRLNETLFNTQTSNFVWKGTDIPTTNYIDPSYKNQLGFTKRVKLGDSEYKLQSSELRIKNNNFTDNIINNPNIEGFTLNFTNSIDTKFKVGISNFDNIETSKYNNNSKYSTDVVDVYSNFNNENKYLEKFRNDKNNFVSNFNKEGSIQGINNIEDSYAGGFITKQSNVRFTNFKINDYQKKDFFLSPIPPTRDRYEDRQEFDLRPKFKNDFRTLYTKLGNPRDIAYNPDLIWHQPFVLRGLMNKDNLGPEVYGWVNSSFDDGFIRGGLLTYANRVVDDAQRMSKFYTSGKGLLFMARQLLLQKTNPNVEIYPTPSTGNKVVDTFFGAISNFLFERPTQTFNPLTQVLSSKGLYGPLLRRHSLDILSGDDIVLGKYEAIVRKRNENSGLRTQLENIPMPTITDREGTDNRLLQLTKELFPEWMKSGFQDDNMNYFANVKIGKNIERLSGKSGPGSFFAVGSTNFKRTEITNGTYDSYNFNNNSTTKLPKLRSLHKHTSDKQYASFENYNNSPLSDRTRKTDTLNYSKEYLFDADINEVVSLTNLITDLEEYDRNTRVYDVNKSYHTINNPFRTINGVLGNNTNSTNLTDTKSPLGEYVAMTYSDIQLLAKEMKNNRSRYIGTVTEGGYSLLEKLERGALNDRYKDRLNLIGRILSDTQTNTQLDAYIKVSSIGSQGSPYNKDSGTRVDRSNPYWFEFPDNKKMEKPQAWLDVLKRSRGDKINLIDVIRGARNGQDEYHKLFLDSEGKRVQDFVPLIFASATYNQLSTNNEDSNASIIIFRATVTSVSDSHTAQWDGSSVMGRGDKVYMYSGYDRTVSFDFKVVATSLEEQYSNWRKLNELASFTAPDFGSGGSSRMMGHVMRLTLGDLYVGVPSLLMSVNYTFNFESGVELGGVDSTHGNVSNTKNVLVLPSVIDVSVSFTIIGNYRPEKGGRLYELTNVYGKTWHPNGLSKGVSPQEDSLDSFTENDTATNSTQPSTALQATPGGYSYTPTTTNNNNSTYNGPVRSTTATSQGSYNGPIRNP